MTIGANKGITIHPALLYVVIAVVSSAFIAWGVVSVNNVKIDRNEKDIIENKVETKRLDKEKADKADINRIYDILNEMKADIKDIKNGKSDK